MNVFSRGMRNAFRNGVRTLSIVLILGLSIGLALSMLLARQAVDAKIESVKSSIGNTITVSPAGVRGFEGGGDPLTADQIASIKDTANVVSVAGTLSDRLTTDNSSLESAIEAGSIGERFGGGGGSPAPDATTGSESTETMMPQRSFTPSVTVYGSSDTTTVNAIGVVTLSEGEQIDGAGSENVALIGADLAEANDLTVGSTFTAYNTQITVKGIISSDGNRFAGNAVILPLTTLQTLTDQVGAVTSAVVTVDSIDNLDTTVTALQTSLGDAADVVSEQTTAESAVTPLESIKSISVFGLIAAVVAGGVIIVLTMVMIVRERRREIGVMKAIGASDAKITLQFMAEAVTLTILAAVIGIVISILAANPITNALVTNASSSTQTTTGMGTGPGGMMGGGRPSEAIASSVTNNIQNITASISWDIVLYGVLTALLLAIIGSAVATSFITKVKPAEAIRAE